jgi:hypothetical protein
MINIDKSSMTSDEKKEYFHTSWKIAELLWDMYSDMPSNADAYFDWYFDEIPSRIQAHVLEDVQHMVNLMKKLEKGDA